jgi:hypothetical protein
MGVWPSSVEQRLHDVWLVLPTESMPVGRSDEFVAAGRVRLHRTTFEVAVEQFHRVEPGITAATVLPSSGVEPQRPLARPRW